jgi:hypothetical protein
MLIDENGEPAIFTHICEDTVKGRPMPFNELQKFAVETLANLFRVGKNGMEIIHINTKFGIELPNLVLKSINEKVYYVAVLPGMFPQGSTPVDNKVLRSMINLANKNNAQAAIAEMGFYSFGSNNPSQPVMGGKFSIKYDGLNFLEKDKPNGFIQKIMNSFK